MSNYNWVLIQGGKSGSCTPLKLILFATICEQIYVLHNLLDVTMTGTLVTVTSGRAKCSLINLQNTNQHTRLGTNLSPFLPLIMSLFIQLSYFID